jgi:hypothetical protein
MLEMRLTLPDEIDFHEDCQGDQALFLTRLYEIFHGNLVLTPLRCDNQLVHIPLQKSEGKAQVFWHIVTRDSVVGESRELNIPRAKRIPWIKPLIESVPSPHIRYWRYLEGNKRVRRYIWAESVDYLIILEEKRLNLYLVTAFNVDSKWKKEDLLKKYSKRII